MSMNANKAWTRGIDIVLAASVQFYSILIYFVVKKKSQEICFAMKHYQYHQNNFYVVLFLIDIRKLSGLNQKLVKKELHIAVLLRAEFFITQVFKGQIRFNLDLDQLQMSLQMLMLFRINESLVTLDSFMLPVPDAPPDLCNTFCQQQVCTYFQHSLVKWILVYYKHPRALS